MVDPRHFAPFDLGAIMERNQRQQMNNLRIEEYREDRANKKRLGDLIPQALGGKDESGAIDQRAAIEQMYGIDPQLAMKLDDRQRAQAKAELDDLSAAVRWADTPEKWGHVQQHYGQKGVDLSPYGYEDRERGIIALGGLSNYLKSLPKPTSQPSSVQEYEYAKAQGFGGSYMDFQNQTGSPIVVDNGDGTKTIYPRSMLGGGGGGAPQGGNLPRVSSPAEARSLPPGSKFIMPDGRIGTVPGGPTPQASGNFP